MRRRREEVKRRAAEALRGKARGLRLEILEDEAGPAQGVAARGVLPRGVLAMVEKSDERPGSLMKISVDVMWIDVACFGHFVVEVSCCWGIT